MPFLRSALLAVLAACAVSSAAAAQQPAPAVPAAPPDTSRIAPLPPALVISGDTGIAPFERPNGALMRPGTHVYDLSSTRDGQVVPLGIRTVQVTESSVAGMPAWLIVETRTGSPVETSDSLFLTRGALLPERWVATSGRAQLGASFAQDTVYGALQSYQGRSSFTVGVGGAALVTPGMVERMVELLPLRVGYRARASLVVIELGTPRAVPAELVVDREETVPVAEQPRDCWVVALRAGAAEERLWVAKDSARVVKTEQAFPSGVLMAVARPYVPPPVAPPVAPPVPATAPIIVPQGVPIPFVPGQPRVPPAR